MNLGGNALQGRWAAGEDQRGPRRTNGRDQLWQGQTLPLLSLDFTIHKLNFYIFSRSKKWNKNLIWQVLWRPGLSGISSLEFLLSGTFYIKTMLVIRDRKVPVFDNNNILFTRFGFRGVARDFPGGGAWWTKFSRIFLGCFFIIFISDCYKVGSKRKPENIFKGSLSV